MRRLKVVYYGPGLSGMWTSISWLLAQPALRGQRRDQRPGLHGTIELPRPADPPLRLDLYRPPMSLFNDPNRAATLRGADGIVFLVEPQFPRLEANVEALENLERFLALDGRQLASVPMVLQYNKRDIPGASVEALDELLNPSGRPRVESIATRGIGVLEAITALADLFERA